MPTKIIKFGTVAINSSEIIVAGVVAEETDSLAAIGSLGRSSSTLGKISGGLLCSARLSSST